MKYYTDHLLSTWFDSLAENSYLVIDQFLEEELYLKLQWFVEARMAEKKLVRIGAGFSSGHQIDESARGDYVYWIDMERDTDLLEIFELMEFFRTKFNQLCFFNLADFEFHLAHYPEGSFYKRHLDRFQRSNNRMVTMIIYLNENWNPGDGGELKIFLPKNNDLQIEPIGNRCVMFFSGELEHEVLPTHKPRRSLTGWMLQKHSGLGDIL